LDPLAKQKLAFSTRYGQFQWNVLPFGPTNGPAAFQRRIMMVLEEHLDTFVIVYLDNVLIYSNDEEEHEKQIKQVLRKLDKASMILNIEKCQFFGQEVKFLGRILSAEGLCRDPRNISKIIDWPTPHNITDVCGFCNTAGHYRSFIDHFAEISVPLTDLQKGSPAKGASITWGK
jgi:Reverse transcriptase (RNA-dependent DNA polymerase)